jgi:hypothetical protein
LIINYLTRRESGLFFFDEIKSKKNIKIIRVDNNFNNISFEGEIEITEKFYDSVSEKL